MSRHIGSKKKKHRAHRHGQRPVWQLLLMHALALGVALLIYALPHHVIPRADEAVGIVSTRSMVSGAAVGRTEETNSQAGSSEDAIENLGAEAELVEWEFDLEAEELQPETEEINDQTETDDVTTGSTESPAVMLQAEASQSPEASPEPESTHLPDTTLEPVATVEPVDEVGSFRIKFADKFNEGKTRKTKNTYVSENLNIKISKIKSDELDTVFYVVDIYVADISCFRTAFAQDKYGIGYTDWPRQIAKDYKSIITMNGDQYGMRKTGVVIRNGKLYRNKKVSNDVCVLYWDGTMKTFSPRDFDANWEMSSGAYQAWNFGPMLLDENGEAKTKFNSSITSKNPRSALGYFEPGHYCFVAVDGRNDESDGVTMQDLAKIMEKLGCKQAYNLDGGRTSMLYAGDTLINRPADGGRKSSDILMILDYVTE